MLLGMKDHLNGSLIVEIQLKRFIQRKVFNTVRTFTEKVVRARQCHFDVSSSRQDDVAANLMVLQKCGMSGAKVGLEDGFVEGRGTERSA